MFDVFPVKSLDHIKKLVLDHQYSLLIIFGKYTLQMLYNLHKYALYIFGSAMVATALVLNIEVHHSNDCIYV